MLAEKNQMEPVKNIKKLLLRTKCNTTVLFPKLLRFRRNDRSKSDLFRMFFFPVRVKNRTTNNHCKNNPHNKNYAELIHFYSSLSSRIPQIENTKNKIIPHTKALIGILSGVAILPMTKIIKIAWLRLKNILAKFCFWRFVNFIKDIIQQAMGFVNPVRNFISSGQILISDSYWAISRISNGVKEMPRLFSKGGRPLGAGILCGLKRIRTVPILLL